jgi:hypothetical protein
MPTKPGMNQKPAGVRVDKDYAIKPKQILNEKCTYKKGPITQRAKNK